jgi:hypothetical protein
MPRKGFHTFFVHLVIYVKNVLRIIISVYYFIKKYFYHLYMQLSKGASSAAQQKLINNIYLSSMKSIKANIRQQVLVSEF